MLACNNKNVYNIYMRFKYTTFVALICGILYGAAILFASITIYNSISERKEQAQMEFQLISDKAAAAAALGFMADPFREAIKDTLESSAVLSAVMVTNTDGVVYALEKKPGYILWKDSEPQFNTTFGLSKPALIRPISVEGFRNVTISAVAEEVDFVLLQRILLNSLLAVLIALVLAVGTLAFNTKNQKTTPTESIGPIGSKQTPPPFEDEIPFDIPNLESNALQERESDCQDSSPKGLYTPLLSISWEEYTRDRLESELHRSASFEQDLTVMIIAFPTLSYEAYPELFKKIADQIVVFFTFRDLIFERQDNGFTILLPNIDLDHSFKMAEEFRKKLITKVPSEILEKAPWGIGLSSRAGRLLEADRLILETSRALEKALEDNKSPIVAFKSDPERYRAYISNKA